MMAKTLKTPDAEQITQASVDTQGQVTIYTDGYHTYTFTGVTAEETIRLGNEKAAQEALEEEKKQENEAQKEEK